jgi:hypothetical protein
MGGLWVGAIGAATSNATTAEIHEACARLRSAMGLIDIIVFNERQKRAWRRFGGVRQGYRRVGPSLDSPLRWRRGGLNEFWLSGRATPPRFRALCGHGRAPLARIQWVAALPGPPVLWQNPDADRQAAVAR